MHLIQYMVILAEAKYIDDYGDKDGWADDDEDLYFTLHVTFQMPNDAAKDKN